MFVMEFSFKRMFHLNVPVTACPVHVFRILHHERILSVKLRPELAIGILSLAERRGFACGARSSVLTLLARFDGKACYAVSLAGFYFKNVSIHLNRLSHSDVSAINPKTERSQRQGFYYLID